MIKLAPILLFAILLLVKLSVLNAPEPDINPSATSSSLRAEMEDNEAIFERNRMFFPLFVEWPAIV